LYWEDAAQVAKVLNDGLIRNSTNQSLYDLGMRASGSGGSLTITSSSGNFVASGVGAPAIATGTISNTASVSDAVVASDLQVFTREGRHLAGVGFTDAQITEFMTAENGFDSSAVYTASYLNDTNSPYRDIDMDVSFVGGMYELNIGSDGVAPALAQGTTIVPGNATAAQTMSVVSSSGATFSIPIETGASANSAAKSLNAVLKNSGIKAEAETRIELFDFQSTGVVSFELEAGNRVPVEISADITPTNLSNLATAINKVSSETGLVAVTSADNARLILTSDAGDDIAVSGIGSSSPEFFGRLINEDAVAQTSPVGTVTSSGAFKTPLSSTNVVTDLLVSGLTVSSNTVAGSGADLSVSSDTSGNYTVTINSGGSGSANPYVVGETFTVDGTLVGGNSSTHDVTIIVSSVDANGVITAATASGFAPGITQAQTTITPTITSGLGAGASFDVTLTDGVATVAVNSAGDGYDENDTFTILGSALGGTDGVNDLTISVASLATTSMVSFGAVVSGNRIDTGRFSGEVSLSSSNTFSLTTTNGTSNAAQDPTVGSFVNVQTNIAGDTKTITYDINEALENGGSGLNGVKAIAPTAAYGLTVPSSNGSISFSADISSSELSTVSSANVNKALVREIRDQAPLASLSGGSTVSATQVVSYSFQRTEAVQPTVDSVTLTINNTDISVDLTDIDGANTSASSAADVTAAIVRAVNNSNLEITASTSGTVPDYGVTLTANNSGEAFTVEAFSFNDVNEIVAQTQFSLTTETPAKSLPSDGSSVAINFGDQIYSLTMVEGEVVVSGVEADRITAYFDASSRLQIFGGGSLSGATISVVSDTEIGGNSAAAAAFGLEDSTARLTGQLFTLTSGMDDLELDFNGTAVTVSLDLSGNVTTVPSSVTGLTLSWEAESATTGRLKAEFDSEDYSLTFSSPTNALGFKTADREISLSGDAIIVKSTDKAAFELNASASSLSGSRFRMNNLPHEDLLVFVTGGGARSIGAEYSILGEVADTTTYEIRAVGDNGNVIEIWDADTGHSIATRVMSGDQQTTYGAFELTLTGRVDDGDKFTLQQDASGANDARNLSAMIKLQDGDKSDPTKLGFQDLFGVMIARVGSSVNSSRIAVEVQEENAMAAKEAEAEFAGVNLDTEAAALIEFQQAYQASARILSTARELFQSLMEVV
jgi:flagellar hook-associated protein FlgK